MTKMCKNNGRKSAFLFILSKCTNPTNQDNWPNVFPYMTLY